MGQQQRAMFQRRMAEMCWVAALVLVLLLCVNIACGQDPSATSSKQALQVEELGTVLVPAPEATSMSGAQSVVVEVRFTKPFQNQNPLVVCTPFFRTVDRSPGRGRHADSGDEEDDGKMLVFAASTFDVGSTGFKILVEAIDAGVLPWRDSMVLVSWVAWDPISFPPAAGGMGSQGGQVPVSGGTGEDFAGDLVLEFPLPFRDPPVVVATARNAIASTVPLSFALTFSKVTETYAVLNVYNLGETGSWMDLIHVDWRAWSANTGASSSGGNVVLGHNNWEVAWTPLSEPQGMVGLSRAFRSAPIILSSILNDVDDEQQPDASSDIDDEAHGARSRRREEPIGRNSARPQQQQFRQAMRRNVPNRPAAINAYVMKKRAPPKAWDTYVSTLKNVNSSYFAANVAKVYQTTLWKDGVYLGWVALNATRVCLDDCPAHGVCVDGRCECAPGYFGGSCQGQCGDCGHGRCDDGLAGSGNCTCEEGYAAESFCQACGFGYFLNPGVGTCQACPGGAENPCSGHSVPPWQCPNGLCVCAAGYYGEDCSVLGKERGWAVVLVVVLSAALLVGLLGFGFRAYRRWRDGVDDNDDDDDDDDDKDSGRGAQVGLLGKGGGGANKKRGHGRRRSRGSSGLDPALRKKLLEQCPELKGMEEALSSLGSDAADWLIDFEKLEIGTRIGAGNSSLVYRGLFFDELVAVKTLQQARSGLDPALFGLFFRQEAELLSKLHHPHVVRFYGVCYHAGDFYIVTEYCEHTLQRLLQQHHTQGSRMAPEDLYRVAFQVANGMAYLHEKQVVHRDLKPENILVDERGNFKICDFGLSKLLSKDNPQMTVQVGTPAFMSPEMAAGTTNMSESVDVYSFGVLLWALWSCRDPYYYLNVTPVQLLSRVVAGLRPRIDPDMPSELVTLMCVCWEQDPALRPTFDNLVAQLRELIKKHEGARRSFVTASVYSLPLSPFRTVSEAGAGLGLVSSSSSSPSSSSSSSGFSLPMSSGDENGPEASAGGPQDEQGQGL